MANSLLLSATGDSEVVNDTTETSIFSGTVPAGTLGTNNLLILRQIGDFLNNTGVNQTYTLRVKFGGTTIHTFTSVSWVTDINRRSSLATVFLGGQNATNSQRSMMEHKQGGPGSDTGTANTGNDHNTSVNKSIAVDSTVDQTLQVTVQLPAASANLAFRRRGVWVESLKDTPASGIGVGTQLLKLHTTEFLLRNTVTDTEVFSFTIPGGTLGTGNLVICQLVGDFRNFTGANDHWTGDAYWGGAQVFNGGATGVANASNNLRLGSPYEIWLGGAGATNAQRLAWSGDVVSNNAGSGEENTITNSSWQAFNMTNAAAVDSTTDQALAIRVDFDTASNELEFRELAAIVAVIKA